MTAQSANQIRVLFVEDSPEDAQLLARQLRRSGLEIDHHDRVASEAELREALKQPWDIVVSDYAMPGFDGVQAARIVRETSEHTPFIFVSGVIGQDRAIRAMRAGVRDYLPKDDLARFDAAIRREISAARRQVAQRKKLERARDFAQAVVSSIPTPVVILDADDVVIATNPAFEETFGVSPELRKDQFTSVCPHIAGNARLAGAIERARAGEESGEFAIDLMTEEGPRHLFASARPLPGAESSERYTLLTVQDVTHRRRDYDRLVTLQRLEAVGRLAGGIAHDFNNMLTIIQNFAALLQDDEPRGTSTEEIGDTIMEVSERAAGLTQQLLAFGRGESQELVVTDLNTILVELMPVLRRLAGDDVVFEYALADDLPPVEVDRNHIEQVVLNIVVNATEAMPDGGSITVRTERVERRTSDPSENSRNWATLSIRDTGVGMDDETAQQALDPFFTTQPFGRGAGLGLSTVYGTVRQAGGHVNLESRPGEGTEVRVSLPPAQTEARGSTQPSHDANDAICVLVVDDDDLVRRSTARVLRRDEFDVIEAQSGAEALEIISNKSVDVMIADVLMPDMTGVELSERVLEEYSEPPYIILASGYTAEEVLDDDLNSRVDFVQKPFRPTDLVKSLRAREED